VKTAPKKIQNRAIKAACLSRDAEASASPQVRARLRDAAQSSFQALVLAMGCTPDEEWMVNQSLGDIVRQTPRKPFDVKRIPRHVA
jgi:hypothetical protein